MSFTSYSPGIGNAGSYMVSGLPWITGSEVDTGRGASVVDGYGQIHVKFPYVSKSFTVINTTTVALTVHFDSRTNSDVHTENHYITLPNKYDSFRFDVRVKDVYISAETRAGTGSFQMFADLTGISYRNYKFVLSGSGINSTGSGVTTW